MVSLSDGDYIRRRVYRDQQLDELRFAENNYLINEVLDVLRKAGLISTGGEAGIRYEELIHDSLINTWATGKKWINDFGKENLTLQRQLWQAVLEHSKASKAAGEQSEETAAQEEEISGLWDRNSKLIQVIQQVADASTFLLAENPDNLLPEEKESFLRDWAIYQEAGEFSDLNAVILEGNSAKLLEILLQKGNHWLNLAEVAFIQQSWEKRIQSILNLQRERDEAVRISKISQSATGAAQAREIKAKNPTVALNLALAAYRRWPTEESNSAVVDVLLGNQIRFLKKTFTGHESKVTSVTFFVQWTNDLDWK